LIDSLTRLSARILTCLQLAALTGLLAGCSTTQINSYERVPESRVDEAYVKPGVDFSLYTRLYAAPLEIYYHEGEGAPTPDDLERMRGIFRAAFLAAIAGDYEIVTEPAPDALGVRASLVDLQKAATSAEIPVEGRLRSLVGNGQLTFLMELSDSVSGEVLARAADRDQAVVEPTANADPSAWAQAEAAATRWASIFRQFLDDNLGR
jgi:hypothetical protein